MSEKAIPSPWTVLFVFAIQDLMKYLSYVNITSHGEMLASNHTPDDNRRMLVVVPPWRR